MKDIRTGNGFDVHRLTEGRRCIICGVDIPHRTGLLGHSDADVALHALCDAILGALALGDIGKHFPDNDERWRGADSRMLLRRCVEMPLSAATAPAMPTSPSWPRRPRCSPT